MVRPPEATLRRPTASLRIRVTLSSAPELRGARSRTAWATFDVTTVNSSAQGFAGGAFDGRYVYLVPWESGLVARLDTTGTFADGSAWTTFDIASVNPSATGFFGAAFDGRYIYLVPNNNGVVARFDALSSPCPLAHPTASFF